MSTPINSFDDPQAYWNDEAGRRWVTHQQELDRFMAPVTQRLLQVAAPAIGEQILDVGCGCGDTTLQFAEKVGPSGHALGVDVSAPMLARARERTSALPQVELLEADAGTHALMPGSVDLVTSRFGVMFFVDPIAAFTNLRKALVPGGRLCVAVWQAIEKNPWMTGPLQALPELPAMEARPEGEPGPFSLAGAAYAGDVLKQAGFVQIRLDSFRAALNVGDSPADAMRFYTHVGPLSRRLDSLEPAERAEAEARVLRYLETHWGTQALPTHGCCWFLQAVAP